MTQSRLARAVTGAGYLLVSFIAFALTCWGIRLVMPFPEVPVVETKLRYLRNHINEYDTLFIGSSRIYRHVVPSVFDHLMTAEGIPTHSFNAGVDGMRPPEDAYLMDQILGLKPEKLRYVFLELGGLRLLLDEDKEGTIRSVYWHDWDRLKILFQRAIYQKKKRDLPDLFRELREPLGIFAKHLQTFAQNVTNVGRGEVVMNSLRPQRGKVPDRLTLGPLSDGYIAANIPQEMPPETRAEYERQLEERKRKPATRDLSDPVSQAVLEQMIAKIEEVGAMPVLIVPPTTNRKNFVPRDDLARRVLVLDFSDVQRYPALYENRHRQDTNHVNAAGAEVFTRLLVKEFAPHARKP